MPLSTEENGGRNFDLLWGLKKVPGCCSYTMVLKEDATVCPLDLSLVLSSESTLSL